MLGGGLFDPLNTEMIKAPFIIKTRHIKKQPIRLRMLRFTGTKSNAAAKNTAALLFMTKRQ